jgi:GTP-binding protein Era
MTDTESTVETRAGAGGAGGLSQRRQVVADEPAGGAEAQHRHAVRADDRERVLGIDSRDGVQMVFVDTPGLVDPRYLLHRAMMHIALDVIGDSDVVLLLIDASAGVPEFGEDVMELLDRAPRLLVVSNKVDVAAAQQRERVREWSRGRFNVEPIEVSAVTGEGTETLRAEIARRLPVSEFLYPEEDVSSQPVRFFVAELIRESVFELYSQEVPYSVATKVEEFRESGSPLYIRAVVFVERARRRRSWWGAAGRRSRSWGRSRGRRSRSSWARRVPGPVGQGAPPLAQGPRDAAAPRVQTSGRGAEIVIEPWLLEMLVCPQCKGELRYEQSPESLVCERDRLRFELRDGIPIMLIDEATSLDAQPAR